MDQAKAPGAGADVDISEKAGRRTGVVMGWRGSREKHVGAVGAGDHQKIAMGDGVGIWGRVAGWPEAMNAMNWEDVYVWWHAMIGQCQPRSTAEAIGIEWQVWPGAVARL